jgi:arylsulfatase A-like enzyme
MKATTWEGGIRVPFMIRYKKVFPENKKIIIPIWSPDIFPTIFSLTNINPSETRFLDGQDITEILKGNQTDHAPVFSMHNYKIMSVRKGDYKLFINKPNSRVVDPRIWVDKKAPDGIHIIAQMEGQPTPAQYPGIIPEKPDKKIQLFDLRNDPTETNDLSEEMPEIVDELLKDYNEFIESLNK